MKPTAAAGEVRVRVESGDFREAKAETPAPSTISSSTPVTSTLSSTCEPSIMSSSRTEVAGCAGDMAGSGGERRGGEEKLKGGGGGGEHIRGLEIRGY
jgi:hypothetical protein